MGQIYVAVSKSLVTKQWIEFDPAEEAARIFPKLPRVNAKIADAWGHPISITIKRAGNKIYLKLNSAGPNGIMDNKDDLVQEFIFDE